MSNYAGIIEAVCRTHCVLEAEFNDRSDVANKTWALVMRHEMQHLNTDNMKRHLCAPCPIRQVL